jgi:hypothetical protein
MTWSDCRLTFLGALIGKENGLLVRFLRRLMRFLGIFHSLPGMFVPGLMVFLAVMRSRSPVCMRGHVVKLSGSLMRIFCHNLPPI